MMISFSHLCCFYLLTRRRFNTSRPPKSKMKRRKKARNRNFDRKNCDHNDAATFLHHNQNGASDVNNRKLVFEMEHFGLKPSTVRRRRRACQFVWPGFSFGNKRFSISSPVSLPSCVRKSLERISVRMEIWHAQRDQRHTHRSARAERTSGWSLPLKNNKLINRLISLSNTFKIRERSSCSPKKNI